VSDDGERDEFLWTLRPVLREIRHLDELRDHARFRALLDTHGEAHVRGWLILEGLRLARQVALDERARLGQTDLTDADAWLAPGVVKRLCENSAYACERITS